MGFGGKPAGGFHRDKVKAVGDGLQNPDEFVGVFVFDRTEDDLSLLVGEFELEGFDEGVGSLSIVGRIKDEIVCHPFKAARPVGVGQSVLNDIEIEIEAGGCHRFACQGGVFPLVSTRE